MTLVASKLEHRQTRAPRYITRVDMLDQAVFDPKPEPVKKSPLKI